MAKDERKQSVEVARGLLLDWRAKLGQALKEDDVVRGLLEKGLQDVEAVVDKVKQACDMREQIESLPAGVVKDHMGRALAQLEAELGLAAAGPPRTGNVPASATAASAATVGGGDGGGGGGGAAAGDGGPTAAMLVARVAQAGGVPVKGPKDALALAVHVILLSEGFVCYAEEEQKGGPTGFAPPVRAVPPTRLVPPNWNVDPAHVTFTYRHDQLKGRDIKLKLMWMEERAVAELQDRSAALTVTLHGPDYVAALGSGGHASSEALAHLHNLDGLRQAIRASLLQPLLPRLASEEEAAAAAAATGGAGQSAVPPPVPAVMPPGRPPFEGQPPFDIPVPGPLGPMAPPGANPAYGYGGRRGGGLVPDFEGDLAPGGPFGGGPGGGNLMGPNHPMFTGERGGGFPGGPGGGGGGGGLGMPAPRFDPYGPVIPPIRGGPPARGPVDPNDPRGRGRAFREPDPDHLPPPGPPGNMYF